MPKMIAPMAMGRPGTSDPAFLRRQALSQQLIGRSIQAKPAYSWGEALASALTPVVQTWDMKSGENRAKERDQAFQDALATSLETQAPGQSVSQNFTNSQNSDVRAMGTPMLIQERMQAARAAARKPIMDESGKFTLGHVDADGKTEWVPSHALPTSLQAEQARAKELAVHPFKMAQHRAGASNITMKVEGEGRGELAKLGAKNFMAYQDAERDANKRAIILDNYEALSKGFQTGATAEWRLKAKQIWKDTTGMDIGDGDIASGEALKSAGRFLELAATPKGQGQITENERTIIREQMPQLLNTPGGNVLVIRAIRELDAYDRKAAAVLREVARKGNGYVDPVLAAEELSKLGPALSPSLYAAITGGGRSGGGSGGIGNDGGGGGGGGITPPPGFRLVK